jgi:hypothetical protein
MTWIWIYWNGSKSHAQDGFSQMDETIGCHPQVLKIARNGIWKELELKWFDLFSFI